jgi:tetratricopeptide (TPR) repeat protein
LRLMTVNNPKIAINLRAIFAILVLACTNAKADQALELADFLYDNEAYDEAIIEYKRYIFFNPEGEYAVGSYRRIASAYRTMGGLSEAEDAYRQAINKAQNDSTREELKIDLAVVLISSQSYNDAEVELLRLAYFSKFPNIKSRASFYLCVNSIYRHNWKDAQIAYGNFSGYNSSVDSLLSHAREVKPKSPRLAKTLSTFMPGLGQTYSGAWFNGINAAALNAAFGYLVADALIKKHYADAFLEYIFLFFRYYRGNRQNSYLLAKKYNETVNRELSSKALEELYKSLSD